MGLGTNEEAEGRLGTINEGFLFYFYFFWAHTHTQFSSAQLSLPGFHATPSFPYCHSHKHKTLRNRKHITLWENNPQVHIHSYHSLGGGGRGNQQPSV